MVHLYLVDYYTIFEIITKIVVKKMGNVNVANEKAIKYLHTLVSKI